MNFIYALCAVKDNKVFGQQFWQFKIRAFQPFLERNIFKDIIFFLRAVLNSTIDMSRMNVISGLSTWR